jgi:hypothetical protein
MQTIITRNQAKQLIAKSAGSIFSTQFIKKDKTIRDMTCRLHVKKHLKHGGKVASTTAHIEKYVTVFEMNGQAKPNYKNINLDTMLTLTIDGKVYVIAHQATG